MKSWIGFHVAAVKLYNPQTHFVLCSISFLGGKELRAIFMSGHIFSPPNSGKKQLVQYSPADNNPRMFPLPLLLFERIRELGKENGCQEAKVLFLQEWVKRNSSAVSHILTLQRRWVIFMLNFQEIPMVDGPLNCCQETILTSLMAVPICILIALKKREMPADIKLVRAG